MRAAVVGLGKIGLPLAVQFASKDVETIGCDIDPEVVDSVNAGVPPFPGEAGLAEMLPGVIERGVLRAATDTAAAVSHVDVVVVVVPLVVNEAHEPSFGAIDAATRDIGRGLRPGQLVVFETTLPVGTTRDRFGPLLEEVSGLAAGDDFHLAFSPERVYSGRIFSDLRRYPKLVGGIDDASTKAAVDFYEQVLDFDERADIARPNGVWALGSAEAAEMAKLAETTYRDVNIALANEFALFAEQAGIDVMEVIDASNSQPFSHIHRPGLVGGHCIPVYPHFYLQGHPDAEIPRASRRVNDAMAAHAIGRLEDHGELAGKRVAVLGATYRGGVKETAFSGAFSLVREIGRAGGVPVVHDPMMSDSELERLGFTPHHLGDPCDVAIVQADHAEYASLSPEDLPGVTMLLDLRRTIDPGRWTGGATLLTLGAGEVRIPGGTQ